MVVPEKPRLLYLVHSYGRLTGVELHTHTLATGLGDRYEVAIAFPERGRIRVVGGPGASWDEPGDRAPWPETPYHEPVAERALGRILDRFRPDLVHIQHFLHWPLSVLDLVHRDGARVVISLHDFYAITPVTTMIGADDPEQTFSAAYSRASFGVDLTGYLRDRRRRIGEGLSRADALVTVSPFLHRQLARIFPAPYHVIEYGIPPFRPVRGGRPPGRNVRFGYFGNLVPHKGWRPLVEAFASVRRRHPEAELHLFGWSEGDLPPADGVTYHGTYQPDELPRLCGSVDVGVIPSLFPESYCLVLSELWMAGLPVAASALGALGERVVDGSNGKTFRAGDLGSMAEALGWFLEHDEWRAWRLPRPREAAAMVADYDRLYRDLLEADAVEAGAAPSIEAGPAAAEGPLLVVQVGDFGDDGDSFYRIHEPSRQLGRLPGVVAVDVHYAHHLLPALVEAADVLVLQFVDDWDLLPIIERRRAGGRVTVFEANDFFDDLHPWNPIGARWQDRSVRALCRAFMAAADAVQTTTEELAARWRPEAREVLVFENQLASVPPLSPPPARPLTIGWGGSPGHFADWYQVAPLLQRWLDARPDVHLAVMTHEFARPFFRLPAERYHFTPFGSLADYQRLLSTVDIGLAPLLPTEYNRCRSDVKFLEYAAHGVAGIYADLEPYRGSVVPGETGLTYRTDAELLECLDRLADDPALREAIRRRAHERVAAGRLFASHIGRRLDAYRRLLRGKGRGTPLPPEVVALAGRDGNYLQLRPGEPERALLAATRGPSTREAEAAVGRLVEAHPGYTRALQHRGRMLNDLGDHDAARSVLEQARRLDPRGARTPAELGRAWFGLGKVAEARAALGEALEANPLYYPGWQYLLRLLALHRDPEGPRLAERAWRLFPTCYQLALAGALTHPPTEAAAAIERLIDEHEPTLAPAEREAAAVAFGDAILEVLRAEGTGPELLPLLRRAAAAFPESARLAHALGQALFEAGDLDESNAHYTRALALHHLASLHRREGFGDDGTVHYWQFADHIRRALGADEPEGDDWLAPG